MFAMEESQIRRLYGDLAWLWPVISPPEEYVAEAEEITAVMRDAARRPVRRVFDLGCGGGPMDFGLKRHFEIVGVDLSEAMLELARGLNPEVTYLCGDLRDPPTDELFDAVYISDAVNHLLSEADLRRAFRAAYDHLKPGGVMFVLAEETRERFSSPRTQASHHAKGDVHVTFIEDVYDPDPTDTTYDLTLIFLIRRDGATTVEVDRHRCGVFPLQTWREEAAHVGFEVHVAGFRFSDLPAVVGVKKLR